jgi:hypothetical protein
MACDGADPLRRLLMMHDRTGVERLIIAEAPLCWKQSRTKKKWVEDLIQHVQQREGACRDLLRHFLKYNIDSHLPRRGQTKAQSIDSFMSVARNWCVGERGCSWEATAAGPHGPATAAGSHSPAFHDKDFPMQLVPKMKVEKKKLRTLWKGLAKRNQGFEQRKRTSRELKWHMHNFLTNNDPKSVKQGEVQGEVMRRMGITFSTIKHKQMWLFFDRCMRRWSSKHKDPKYMARIKTRSRAKAKAKAFVKQFRYHTPAEPLAQAESLAMWNEDTWSGKLSMIHSFAWAVKVFKKKKKTSTKNTGTATDQ